MKIYVITVRYKEIMDNEWQFITKIIEAKNVREAINKTYEDIKEHFYSDIKIIVDNIYSEQK
mgnify:CR=1 FL=1